MNTTREHDLREVAQVFEGHPQVRAADITTVDGQRQLEAIVGPEFDRIPCDLLRIAGRHDIGLDPDRSGSRGSPRHYVVVFC